MVPDEKKTLEFEIGSLLGGTIIVVTIMLLIMRACGHL